MRHIPLLRLSHHRATDSAQTHPDSRLTGAANTARHKWRGPTWAERPLICSGCCPTLAAPGGGQGTRMAGGAAADRPPRTQKRRKGRGQAIRDNARCLIQAFAMACNVVLSVGQAICACIKSGSHHSACRNQRAPDVLVICIAGALFETSIVAASDVEM